MRNGGIGMIEEGELAGRRFIIPSEVLVEKGARGGAGAEWSKACLIHHKFIPDSGCPDCAREVAEAENKAHRIGLG
jgi:hypothetical protein